MCREFSSLTAKGIPVSELGEADSLARNGVNMDFGDQEVMFIQRAGSSG